MKRIWTQRLGDFLLGRGFYIVLALTMATVGASGYYLVRSAAGPAQETPLTPVTGQATVPAQQGQTPAKTQEDRTPVLPQPKPKPEPKAEPAPAQTPKVEEKPLPKVAPQAYVWPLKGTVVRPFSVETLSYDQTMGDWRTHGGVDLSAVEGTLVSAARGGTVEQIFVDEMLGTTLVLDHGDGAVSAYSGLAASPPVKEGDWVDTGATIGSVGPSPLGESALTPHLHLSLVVDGLERDPLDYLPEL